MVTGFYGGMGYNPWATFDWNTSGTNSLVTPFFSAIQQYAGRVLSGIIIIAMYYSNFYWSAYTPINSNEAFANDGTPPKPKPHPRCHSSPTLIKY